MAKNSETSTLRRTLLSTLICVALAGCASGPDFVAPAAPGVDRYTAEAAATHTVATPVKGGEAQTFVAGENIPQEWWKLFGNEPLNDLVKKAIAENPNVASAQAALRQVQEVLNAGRGDLYPTIDAGLSAERQRTNGAGFGQPTTGTNLFNLYNASVNVSYALDVFGGVRRMLEAQQATVEYQQFELQATYQTLAANVVTSAVAEASLRAQVAATREIVADQERQLHIVEKQFEFGSISRADVLSAQSDLSATRATLVQLEKQRSAMQNQLAVYVGKFPSELEMPSLALEDLTLPQSIPLSLPSELVRRRPDVRASEALLHQASAQIGVASADMLPKVSLNGSYGSQSARWSRLFDENIWSLGASIVQPLFHGGALAAQKRAAIAAYDEAFGRYRQTVLTAFADVADSLNALEADARILQARHVAETSAKDGLTLTEAQFKAGGASYLQLLTSQRQYQQARIAYLQALASRYQDTAALFLALGGNATDAGPQTEAEDKAAANGG